MPLFDLSRPIILEKAIAEYERLKRRECSLCRLDSALLSSEFSERTCSHITARQLSTLGFDIVGVKQSGWSLEKCEATVSRYLDFPRDPTRGTVINSQHIVRGPNGPMKSSIENKFQKIHRVFDDEESPRLGILTNANYQQLLNPGVRRMIPDRHGVLHSVTTVVRRYLVPTGR